MKAVRYYGIQDVRCEEIAKPQCGSGEVLIRVAYAGICGSDLHIYNKQMFIQNIPETMGHEFVGIIEECGAEVKGFKPEDRVIANPMVTCGECEGCRKGLPNTCAELGFIGEVRPGCFAEYIVLEPEALIPVPKEADLEQEALAEPLAVVLNLCERADLCPEDEIAIIGAGPISLLTIIAAKSIYGVKSVYVCGRSAMRLELAGRVGADYVDTVLPENKKFDKVIEIAGREATFNMAVEHTQPNGTLCVVSIFEDEFIVDLNLLVASQIRFIGCNAYERRHLEDAVRVIAEGKVDVTPLISAEYDLAECAKAFEALNEKDKTVAKILFSMSD